MREDGGHFFLDDFPGIGYVFQQVEDSRHLPLFFSQQAADRIDAGPLRSIFLLRLQCLQEAVHFHALFTVVGMVFFRPSGYKLSHGGQVEESDKSPVGQPPFTLPAQFLPLHRAFLSPFFMHEADDKCKAGYQYEVSCQDLQFEFCLYHSGYSQTASLWMLRLFFYMVTSILPPSTAFQPLIVDFIPSSSLARLFVTSGIL